MTFNLDPAMPPLVTDAERLRLVLVNVLTNARCAVAARNGQAPIHHAMVAGSKQSWLTMWVAIGALANIAWIVSSSEIR